MCPYIPNIQCVFDMALLYEQQGDYHRAYQLFQECIYKEGVDTGDVFFHCAWCLEQSGGSDPEKVLELYQKASRQTRIDIVRMNSSFRAGWILLQEWQYRKAGEYFLEVVELAERQNDWNDISCNALYWYALTLENQGQYLEAIRWHRKVQAVSAQFLPESRFRELLCLVRIGAFQEALHVCQQFTEPPPHGFDPNRYLELQQQAEQEKQMLEAALKDDYLSHRNN